MTNEITMTENDKKIKLEELKQYATDIGLEFRENIGIARLEQKIKDKEDELAQARREQKVKAKKEGGKKVKVILEPRDPQPGINDQFFGYTSMDTGAKENILIMFGEECEISERMYEHIKNITFTEKKFKMVPDADGIPRKQWYDKKQTRFIISKV